jgi:hypothetical protein
MHLEAEQIERLPWLQSLRIHAKTDGRNEPSGRMSQIRLKGAGLFSVQLAPSLKCE